MKADRQAYQQASQASQRWAEDIREFWSPTVMKTNCQSDQAWIEAIRASNLIRAGILKRKPEPKPDPARWEGPFILGFILGAVVFTWILL